MTTATKDSRLELRLSSSQKREIEQAASIEGRTVTEFSVPLLVAEATDVIRRQRELRMSDAAWEAFNDVLDQPAQSLAGLKELFRKPSVFEG